MSDEQQWSDDLSASWERHRADVFEAQRNVSEWLIDEVDPRPGETGFLAAERVEPTGTLISTDLGAGMVEAASRGATARGTKPAEAVGPFRHDDGYEFPSLAIGVAAR